MSMDIKFVLPRGRGVNRLRQMSYFSSSLIDLCNKIGMKLSSRGWCYQLEGFRLIDKSQFDLVENIINECRELGFLPIDFVAEEEARGFSGVEKPEEDEPKDFLGRFLVGALTCEQYYTPDWWEGEEYYIQMVVEKIDVKTLFEPVCREYHIPIATSKGWSSMLQRAEYARRFKQAEEKGLKCVLLYCGDHDPDGLRISDFLRSNLRDLKNIRWNDGVKGYDPSDLIIDRFGLNYDFIIANNLTWIDNLITGSGKNLASPTHPNHFQYYVQDYLKQYGARKCEANSLVVIPDRARQLCRESIEKYLGDDALERFADKREEVAKELEDFRESTGIGEAIKKAIKQIQEEK